VRDTASRAMQVGLCPRMRIVPTSSDEAGQIYVPTANWLLMIGTLLIVVLFKTSENLAGAYGIAVSGTMLVTTILLYRVAIGRWQWPPALAIFIIVVFGAVDATFLRLQLAEDRPRRLVPDHRRRSNRGIDAVLASGVIARAPSPAGNVHAAPTLRRQHRRDGGGASSGRGRVVDQGRARRLADPVAPRQAQHGDAGDHDPDDLRRRPAPAGAGCRAPFDRAARPWHLSHPGTTR